MITKQEWDQKTDTDKFDYLRWHSQRTEEAVAQLGAALQQLRQQVAKLETRLGENARRWDKRGRPESLLLRGDDIDGARKWVAARNTAAP